MIALSIYPFTVHKRFPLTISRGTTTENTNLWVRMLADNREGWGEISSFSVTRTPKPTIESLAAQIQSFAPQLATIHPLEREKIALLMQNAQLHPAVQAGIDIALHDWLGKQANLPLWKLWGLDIQKIVPTSVTIGISSPEAAQAKVKKWQDFIDAKVFKLKLGNPEGLECDRALFRAVRTQAPQAELTVDANGGWSLENALEMCDWLAQHNVRHLEQPLPTTHEEGYSVLYSKSPIPIFIDESCFNRRDLPRFLNRVHGINLKVMKTGGLREALRTIHAAQALGLQIMLGCYSDSSIANTAMAHLSPYADYIDLDSHLNLLDDPFMGAQLKQGRLIPRSLPGLGVEYRASHP
ncbi:MAG: dipeptide epimerase [Jaaginema sp. PMC 1079.18]|nr:dipeptide epimerase [Jaaginema sp. PMC 1080.18]MEC4849680.1 dipeptide epimerase [Jaaginema sp. PMC 1079.18]MEC4866163.1 dipeptide epimerase [Jaaginema sp. PMC 1078.18]